MRQTYYGVDSKVDHELADELVRYSQLARELFHPSTSHQEKSNILKDKETLQLRIRAKLSESGQILGFLLMEQVDDLIEAVRVIENENVKHLLGSNRIPFERIEEVIGALMKVNVTKATTNLIFFLEKAKQKRQNVVAWIM